MSSQMISIQQRGRVRRRPGEEALPSRFGWLAGLDARHDFQPLWPTAGAPQCVECFGWRDDVRHLVVGR